jgi:hypothetical protein
VITKSVEAIAQDLDSRLTVLGVVSGKANYVEILLGIRGCDEEPCRVTVGVDRLASLDDMRAAIRKSTQHHLRHHVH